MVHGGGAKKIQEGTCPLLPYFSLLCVSYAGYAHVMDRTTNRYITFYATIIFIFKL